MTNGNWTKFFCTDTICYTLLGDCQPYFALKNRYFMYLAAQAQGFCNHRVHMFISTFYSNCGIQPVYFVCFTKSYKLTTIPWEELVLLKESISKNTLNG